MSESAVGSGCVIGESDAAFRPAFDADDTYRDDKQSEGMENQDVHIPGEIGHCLLHDFQGIDKFGKIQELSGPRNAPDATF
ncbi:hypothetical protein [Janthinobacterium sp. 1_2014MBL_MicDiv]|uniref:hypothetical protein n=1 Tax=Janthinobacterium sp. 1_2014MBL_MicDiv TaxID=1644131 RepID=UPI0012EBD3C3|nr:hypothetical protein [Janthinobacterium sp. 1_2014MBL_MicDiv]